MAGDEFNPGSASQVAEVISKLEEIWGPNWWRKLATGLTEAQRSEVAGEPEKQKEPLTEPAPPPPGQPLIEPRSAPSSRPPLTEPAPPPSGKQLNG